jgi:hypothetical protein
MALPEREISGVASEATPGVEARLAGLEEEAARLRAEVASLQDEIRWLTGEDADDRGLLSDGWLQRGWVRASMLMAVVGLVACVSLPYVLYLFDASASQAASATTRPAEPDAPSATIAPTATASEYIPAPVRVRAAEITPPAYVRARSTAATRGISR